MALRSRLANFALILALSTIGARAQDGGTPLPGAPPAPFKPDASAPPPESTEPDTWIFSGALQSSHEPFSGTLVTGNAEVQFELKLGGGATCTGGDLKGEVGLVRLSEITCSDDRKMRALFVPQGGDALRVFGNVGEEKFSTSAHLLGTEAIPDKKQSAAPKAPLAPDLPTGTPVPGPAPASPKDSPG